MTLRRSIGLSITIALIGFSILNCKGLSTLKGTDATLKSLTFMNGGLAVSLTPSFLSTVYAYTANVGNSVTSVVVTATATDTEADFVVSGNDSLVVGTNTIRIVVTAEDGAAKKTYTVTVTRAAPLSANTALSALSLSAGTLVPAFNAATTTYTATVANAVASVTVNAAAADASASFAVSGNAALTVGSNTVQVVVTAAAGNTQTYTVTVTRAASDLSTNATLTALSIFVDGASGITDFSPTKMSYTVSSSCGNNDVNINMTPAAGATIKAVNKIGQLVTVGAFITKALGTGDNFLDLIVTAEDGATTNTYTVNVNRVAPATTLVISAPADKSTITSGTNVTVTGTYSGTTPAQIFVMFGGLNKNATITGTAWTVSFDTSTLPNGADKFMFVQAQNGSGRAIGIANSSFALTGSAALGYTVSGNLVFPNGVPTAGDLLVWFGANGPAVLQFLPVTGAASYSYSFNGISAGTYNSGSYQFNGISSLGSQAFNYKGQSTSNIQVTGNRTIPDLMCMPMF